MSIPHDLDTSPVDWVVDQPSAKRVFDELGIDWTCPGKSLAGQCERLGLDPQDVLQRLRIAADGDAANRYDAESS